MQTVSQLTSLLVLTGALFMVAAIALAHKVKGRIPGALMPRWRLVIGLMYFFIAGYAVFIVILVSRLTLPTEIISGPVFLGGAVFVFIVISLTRKSLEQLRAGEDKLLRVNESLEKLVAERTEAIEHYATALETSNKELKSVIYGISHDLRAPLVNITGFSAELANTLKEMDALLGSATSPPSDDELEHLRRVIDGDIPAALGFINSSAGKMDQLINSFLKLSHIGRRKLKWETIDMNDLVGTALKQFDEEIAEHQVRVAVGNLPHIIADWASISQVVETLLDNALKYLDPDRDGVVEISGELTGGETVFHVRDNGRGIAKEDVPKIFDLFRRAGHQTVPGEGMGLAYARILMRRHDGRIWCVSAAGHGSTFSFSVPQSAATGE